MHEKTVGGGNGGDQEKMEEKKRMRTITKGKEVRTQRRYKRGGSRHMKQLWKEEREETERK